MSRTRITYAFDIEADSDIGMRAMGMGLGVHLDRAVEAANRVAQEPSHIKVLGAVKIVHWELSEIGKTR